MIAEQLRSEVWYELLDMERFVRYYGAMHDQYQRRYFALRFLLLASVTAGVVSAVALLPGMVQIALGALVAVLIVLDFVFNDAKKTAVLHAIQMQCDALLTEYRQLWLAIEGGDKSDAAVRDELRALQIRCNHITGWAGQTDIPVNHSLNAKCVEDADTGSGAAIKAHSCVKSDARCRHRSGDWLR